MKSAFLILIVTLVVVFDASAQSTQRLELVQRLANEMGVSAQLEEIRRQGIEFSNFQSRQMLANAKTFKIPSDVEAELLEIQDEYSRRLSESWDSRMAASIYVNTLMEGLTDDEIASAIAYYSSTQGRKIRESMQLASAKMSQYIEEKSAAAATHESKILMDKLANFRARVLRNARAGQ